MLDVNDFTAVRISLASPEQIRNWSYGEITKPETINYRTLKPEKDGLFCEKIFGPTKDFECYCGKYKRVRYKGITCDKCGVEVTRSKVRRERMGHVELASPVGHIWFVKGTPSRLSILLDISPRSLERVIYFAQFIITTVDEASKQHIIDRMKEEVNASKKTLEDSLNVRRADAYARLQESEGQISLDEDNAVASLQSEHNTAIENLAQQFASVEHALVDAAGKKAKKEITFERTTIVPKGEIITEDHLSTLSEQHGNKKAELESMLSESTDTTSASFDSKKDVKREEAAKEIEGLEKELGQQTSRLQAELAETLDDMDTVRPGMLLTEVKYRELRDKFGIFFSAGMGAEAVLDILRNMSMEELKGKLQLEILSTSGQRRKKATKRLRVVEAFRKSNNKPEWMVMTVLPVLPPDLRPMVQLDGGRFATSDLNDLYRRVISRNNRLKRLMELGAPEIIIRNEKRMLQEAVDSLIDNGRRGRAVANSSSHRLKSLSDLLKGKQGRFRQNLLGKRVDYSGRSVIVVGPELKLHQCGIPKRMALELFKPFVMRKLVEHGLAHNIKSAKRIVERVRPEVWDVLEEAIKDRPVLLNRAPTLHRLGIQAFEPVLIEGSAIQIHPLVCTAFNADFDGDQMAVHVPLSRQAVDEAKRLMLSTNNLLSPSSGEPIVAPTLDMVLGCYYLTINRVGEKGDGMTFGSYDEAQLAYNLGVVGLHAAIRVRDRKQGVGLMETTVGRIIFNEILPAGMDYRNEVMDKKALKDIIAQCYVVFGNETTARVADDIKRLGFIFATRSGITIAATDLDVPIPKAEILENAETSIEETEAQYRRGLITDEERYNRAI
ncbi:MAG: DNA-directed RNA polymerase subunit beta', partial [Dehalococcoidia bacterium]|nr:DNA-directed RNA polymerase subunit beta' [Dehalococcoidia bacterium]